MQQLQCTTVEGVGADCYLTEWSIGNTGAIVEEDVRRCEQKEREELEDEEGLGGGTGSDLIGAGDGRELAQFSPTAIIHRVQRSVQQYTCTTSE